MKNIVVGTAGHIDHGKTALVGALTGIDTDRLNEEKRRGISIDLGFAHLKLTDDIRVAFIDVPGHERFIKNMLAGVGGIDAVVLAVAADESVKPQTREHFDICRLLRIPRGIVALTKSDLVDTDILELVRLEVEEFVAGSFLEGAPMIPVSAVTGAGLDQLRAALAHTLRDVPARDSSQHFRMPVDRAFVMQGFGTVATGTVVAGTLNVEDEVAVYPGGEILRVRGIQVHGSAARRVIAGQRAALNLAGINTDRLHRGTVLGAPGKFEATTVFDAVLELLPTAKPLKNRAPVHLHGGTAETVAEVRTLGGAQRVAPGAAAPVRIVLREPLLLVPGDRFIVRMFSPVVTIGGGEVVDSLPPASKSAERVSRLASAGLDGRVALLVSESDFGLALDRLVARTGATAAAITASLPPGILRIDGPQTWLASRDWARGKTEQWRRALAEFHRANPLLPGMNREEFRSRELSGAPPFVFDAILAGDKTIAITSEYVHLASHKLAFKQDEEQALARIAEAFERAGLTVPGVQEVLAASGVDAARARTLLQILLREKRLIRVSEDLVFHPSAVASLRSLLEPRRGVRFTVSEFKTWTGISRKYAIPLLEFLDRERITRREGDTRVVL